MRVCFPFIAQMHQIYHAFPIAAEIARRHPEVEVRVACTSQEQADFVRTLQETYYPDADIKIDMLSWGGAFRKAVPHFGGLLSKLSVLYGNIRYFRGFDALVVPERTTLLLRRFLPRRTRLVWTRHGAGDRAVGFKSDIAKFDFVLMAGSKIEQRLLDAGLIKPGRYVSGVYAKFDLVRRMSRARLFDNDRPTVVYNPHFWPKLSSWPDWGRGVLDFFAKSDRYNLIFAPHLRLFYGDDGERYQEFLEYARLPNIHVDLGSPALSDMTYTEAADLYLGDVSSQVAEFVIRPRPVVFLNAHGVNWQGNPDYQFWSLGPVVDDMGELQAAIDAAIADKGGWRARQDLYRRETFGDMDNDTAPKGADAIIRFLSEQARA